MRFIRLIPKLAVITVLVVVSGYCEISLFIDFAKTDNTVDTLQMGALAGSLVVSQHILAQQAAQLFALGHRVASGLVSVLVVVLLVISVSASAVFYESRYQTSRSGDLQAGTGYQLRAQLIADQQASIQELKALAKTEKGKGNTWMAGQHENKAQQIQASLPDLIAELDQVQAPVTSSAGIVANVLDGHRWIAWIIFGLIADLIPMLLLVLLTVYPDARYSEKQHISGTTPETSNVSPTSLTSLIKLMGRMPTWREVKAAGITYKNYRSERKVLEQSGVVYDPGDGSGFKLATQTA